MTQDADDAEAAEAELADAHDELTRLRSELEAAKAEAAANMKAWGDMTKTAASFTLEAREARSQLSDTERRLGRAVELLNRVCDEYPDIEVPADPTTDATDTLCQICACLPHGDGCWLAPIRTFVANYGLDRPLPSPPGGASDDTNLASEASGAFRGPTPSRVAAHNICPECKHFHDGERDCDERCPCRATPPQPAAEPPECLKPRSPEELAAAPRLTKEAIAKAISDGERDRRIALGLERAIPEPPFIRPAKTDIPTPRETKR
jgi:hypothetical protein